MLANTLSALLGIATAADVPVYLAQDVAADQSARLAPAFRRHEGFAAYGTNLSDRFRARLDLIPTLAPVVSPLRQFAHGEASRRARPAASTAADLVCEVFQADGAAAFDDHAVILQNS